MINKKIIETILTNGRYKNYILCKNCLIKSNKNVYIYNNFKLNIKYFNKNVTYNNCQYGYYPNFTTEKYKYKNSDDFFIYDTLNNKYFYNSEYEFIILSEDFFIFSNEKSDFIGEYYFELSQKKIHNKRIIKNYTIDCTNVQILRYIKKITSYSPRFFKNNDNVDIIIDEKNKKIYIFESDSDFEFIFQKYYYLIFNPLLISRKFYLLFFFKKYNIKKF